MEDLRRYVLYSRKQEEAFRNRYANVIAARRRAYVKWLRSLPLLEWVDYLVQVSPRDYEAVIGLICVCHQERLVSITFSSDYRRIRRDPDTDEELKAVFGLSISKINVKFLSNNFVINRNITTFATPNNMRYEV